VKDLNHLSRAVSRALRHEPWLYELELDEEGWADIGTLLMALCQEYSGWSRLAETDLAEMIYKSSKQRHEMTNGRSRALYSHSFPGRLQKVPGVPPAQLFHGTAPAASRESARAGCCQ
jgi:putative RNA 2'-phosphotransferase